MAATSFKPGNTVYWTETGNTIRSGVIIEKRLISPYLKAGVLRRFSIKKTRPAKVKLTRRADSRIMALVVGTPIPDHEYMRDKLTYSP